MGIDMPLALPFSASREWLARSFTSMHLGGSETSGIAIAFVSILLIGLLCGWINGLLVARGRLAPFIATLGTMAAFRSIIMSLLDGSEIRSDSANLFRVPGSGPWPAVTFFAIVILAAILLRLTRYGRYVIAIGANERAAIYSAVNVDRVKLLTYILSGGCCGIAALLLASRMNSIASASAGGLYELDAIAAVAIGGTRMRGGLGLDRRHRRGGADPGGHRQHARYFERLTISSGTGQRRDHHRGGAGATREPAGRLATDGRDRRAREAMTSPSRIAALAALTMIPARAPGRSVFEHDVVLSRRQLHRQQSVQRRPDLRRLIVHARGPSDVPRFDHAQVARHIGRDVALNAVRTGSGVQHARLGRAAARRGGWRRPRLGR
jgi:hypothetical protein